MGMKKDAGGCFSFTIPTKQKEKLNLRQRAIGGAPTGTKGKKVDVISSRKERGILCYSDSLLQRRGKKADETDAEGPRLLRRIFKRVSRDM